MIQEKIDMLEVIADKMNVSLYKYYLEGSYDVLLQRVKDRDIKQWKTTDEDRFKYIYDKLNSKVFIDYNYLNIETQSSQEIASMIIKDISEK